jgi:hypothetical protein
MSALNPQQFGSRTDANQTHTSTNGQGSSPSSSSGGTTTTVTVKGSAPAISTRSS